MRRLDPLVVCFSQGWQCCGGCKLNMHFCVGIAGKREKKEGLTSFPSTPQNITGRKGVFGNNCKACNALHDWKNIPRFLYFMSSMFVGETSSKESTWLEKGVRHLFLVMWWLTWPEKCFENLLGKHSVQMVCEEVRVFKELLMGFSLFCSLLLRFLMSKTGTSLSELPLDWAKVALNQRRRSVGKAKKTTTLVCPKWALGELLGELPLSETCQLKVVSKNVAPEEFGRPSRRTPLHY